MLATLGIDLGGTSARAAVVDDAGTAWALLKAPVASRAPETIAELLVRLASDALRAARVPAMQVRGAVVGVAGMIARGTGVVVNAPNLGWRDVPFQALLQRSLPFPVRIANDLSVAAYGERMLGAGRGAEDVALVFVGTGVGAGLVVGGRLLEGATGVGGELGHTKVRPGGRRCGCGELGCLEAYAAGASLGLIAAERAGESARLASALAQGPLTAGVLEEAASAGDRPAREILEDAGTLLGVATANLVTLLNPAVLVLGGGVLSASPTVRRLLEAGVDAHASRASRRALSIADAALGDEAGALGAALIARGLDG